MTSLWLRQRDGTLLSEVEDWTVVSEPNWRRRGFGESVVSIPLTDPCMDVLLWDTPEDPERPWKTVYDADIELAWFADGVKGVEPTGVPTWAGPVVAGKWTRGRLEVRAYTQEWYVLGRGVVGGELFNYLGLQDFDVDPDLDYWYPEVGATASTTTTGPLYTGTHAALLHGTMTAFSPEVPAVSKRSYVNVSVAAYVPSGVTTFFDIVGIVRLQTAPLGTTSWVYTDDEWYLTLPDDWDHDQWHLVSVPVSRPAGVEVRYVLELIGGSAAIRFARPRITRPQNVGAAPGADISQVPAAIFNGQTALLPGAWSYSVDAVGVDLVESARYFTDDHPDVASAIGDWDAYGEAWVEELVMRWAPTRGVYQGAVEFDISNLSGWAYEVDATDAVTELIAQIEPASVDGPPDEVRVSVDSPNWLPKVAQVPSDLAPADAVVWAEAGLEAGKPRTSVSGMPAPETGPLSVAAFGLGDWMDVTLTDPTGALSVTLQPVVDELSWHPITKRTTPSWSLSGKERPDVWALITAELRALERERRRRAPAVSKPKLGITKSDQSDSLLGFGPGANHTMTVSEGIWKARAVHHIDGGSGGTFYCNVYDNDDPLDTGDGKDTQYFMDDARSGQIVLYGPATIGAFGRSDVTGTLTERYITIYATRVG